MQVQNNRKRNKTQTKRAEQLLEKGLITKVGRNKWLAKSESREGVTYTIKRVKGKLECDCEECKHRGSCKHTKGVILLKAEKSQNVMKKILLSVLSILIPICDECDSRNVVKYCTRKRVQRKPAQRHICNDCGHTFTHDPGFKGRHYSPGIIVNALLLHAMKLSGVETSLEFSQRLVPVNVHPDTVLRWGEYYNDSIWKFVRSLRVWSSRMYSVDEKKTRACGKRQYVYVVKDALTKFVFAWDVSPLKVDGYNANGLFADTVLMAGLPAVLISDGLLGFKSSFENVFWRKGRPPWHIREIHMQDEYNNNNAHEKFNDTLGERLQLARGLKKVDSAIIGLWHIYYNFIRPHKGLDKMTPARAAGIEIEGNVFEVLIRNAAMLK